MGKDNLKPRLAGTSREHRLNPQERMLVEWVATASPGDRIPEPWRWAHKPTWSVVITLVSIGLIESPGEGRDITEVVSEARVAAQAWLQAHPADGGPALAPQ